MVPRTHADFVLVLALSMCPRCPVGAQVRLGCEGVVTHPWFDASVRMNCLVLLWWLGTDLGLRGVPNYVRLSLSRSGLRRKAVSYIYLIMSAIRRLGSDLQSHLWAGSGVETGRRSRSGVSSLKLCYARRMKVCMWSAFQGRAA